MSVCSTEHCTCDHTRPFAVSSGVLTVHFFFNVTILVIKLLRKDKTIMDKYTQEGSDDEGDERTDKWRRKLSLQHGVILKLTIDEDAKTGGGIFGLFKRAKPEIEEEEEDTAEAEEEESSSEYESSSESESEPEPEPEPKVTGRWAQGATRGRGRGHRWSRGGRSNTRNRGGSRVFPSVPVSKNNAINKEPQKGPELERSDGEPQPVRKTYGDVRPLRTAGALFSEIAEKEADESDSDETTSSEDSELEDLQAEVRRFEQQVASRKVDTVEMFDAALGKAAKKASSVGLAFELRRAVLAHEEGPTETERSPRESSLNDSVEEIDLTA
jgi:hypothetical protein